MVNKFLKFTKYDLNKNMQVRRIDNYLIVAIII